MDGIATTELTEVLHNNRRRIQEGTWLLPLPQDAVADGFEMTVNGKTMQSEVLDAATSRAIYEDIVRQQKDPALLEYMDNGCLRARAFPIPALGDVTLKVRYRHVTPTHEELRFEGWIHEQRGRRLVARATCHAGETLTADAEGVFIEVDFDEVQERMMQRRLSREGGG